MINYTRHPIRNFQSLLKQLRVGESRLNNILANKPKYYFRIPKKKKDGSDREVYDTHPPLKSILRTITDEILDRVKYPGYLHGSLRKRSASTNVKCHVGARHKIQMDIKDFFPSITKDHVFALFRYGFQFSKKVSRTLAEITTFNDTLPQGSPASSHIANWVLWDVEDGLVKVFSARGYRYTRHVDDIAVSSLRKISNAEKSEIIKRVNSLITCKGFNVKHKKTKLSGPNDTKELVGLVVGAEKPNIPKKYVSAVRAEIEKLSPQDEDYDKNLRSLKGKIAYVKSINPSKGRFLAGHLSRAKHRLAAN